MKRIITLSLLTAALFFTQCKKNNQTSEENPTASELSINATEQNKLAVQSLLNLPDMTTRKLAFKLLLPIERYLLWIGNIKTVSADFNPEQKAVAAELATFLKPSLFVEANNSTMKTFSEKWLVKATKVLTRDQIQALIYEIRPAKTVTAVNSTGLKTNIDSAPVSTDCNCNGDSGISCKEEELCPTDEGCTNPTRWGCGFSWVWPCDGGCRMPKIYTTTGN